MWRGWKKKREKGEKERGREDEEKARETERRRIHFSTLELSTNTKPDPKPSHQLTQQAYITHLLFTRH